jgi:hypothetical protein
MQSNSCFDMISMHCSMTSMWGILLAYLYCCLLPIASSLQVGFLRKLCVSDACVIRPRVVGRSALVRGAPHVLPPRAFSGEAVTLLVEVLKV